MIKIILLLLISLNANAVYRILGDTVGIGDPVKPELGAALVVQSTTKSSIPCPKMTEVQRDALVISPTGGCVFNLTSADLGV